MKLRTDGFNYNFTWTYKPAEAPKWRVEPLEDGSGVTSPFDTPGQIWRNGDHWNFLVVGERYTTTDPTWHRWRRVPSEQWPRGERRE